MTSMMNQINTQLFMLNQKRERSETVGSIIERDDVISDIEELSEGGNEVPDICVNDD